MASSTSCGLVTLDNAEKYTVADVTDSCAVAQHSLRRVTQSVDRQIRFTPTTGQPVQDVALAHAEVSVNGDGDALFRRGVLQQGPITWVGPTLARLSPARQRGPLLVASLPLCAWRTGR